MWYWLCWFLRVVDPTAPRPLALDLEDSDLRDGTDRVPSESPAAHHDEGSDRNAVRALRRLKFFQMLRGDHRHARNATSRPPSEQRHEMPGRVAAFPEWRYTQRGEGWAQPALQPRGDRPTAGSSRRAGRVARCARARGWDPRGGSPATSGELPDAIAEAPRRPARASFGLRDSCLTMRTLSESRDRGGETCA